MLNINQYAHELEQFIKKNYVRPEPVRRTFSSTESSYINDDSLCLESISCVREKRSLDDVIHHINDTFQQSMFYLIDTKKLDEVQVYKDAHIDRKLFSKIRSDKDFHPSKKTVICLCFGMKLNLDETKDLLERAGYTLSHSSVSDLIIEFCIQNEIYDLMDVNEYLDHYKEPVLC